MLLPWPASFHDFHKPSLCRLFSPACCVFRLLPNLACIHSCLVCHSLHPFMMLTSHYCADCFPLPHVCIIKLLPCLACIHSWGLPPLAYPKIEYKLNNCLAWTNAPWFGRHVLASIRLASLLRTWAFKSPPEHILGIFHKKTVVTSGFNPLAWHMDQSQTCN